MTLPSLDSLNSSFIVIVIINYAINSQELLRLDSLKSKKYDCDDFRSKYSCFEPHIKSNLHHRGPLFFYGTLILAYNFN